MSRERIKYDIWHFKFSCLHNCEEWKWGRCIHCRSRHKCKDYSRPVYPSEEGVYNAIEKIEISPQDAEDLGTYVHEFTESAIIRIFKRWHKDCFRDVSFKGYRRTYITHFISVYGDNNGTCLEPVTKRNRPRW